LSEIIRGWHEKVSARNPVCAGHGRLRIGGRHVSQGTGLRACLQLDRLLCRRQHRLQLGTSNTTVSFFNSGTGALIESDGSSFSLNGVIGGGQVGYNKQTANFVWGLEADIQASGQKGGAVFTCTACVPPPVTETINQKLDWFGTVRGRIGYTVEPNIIAYVTGGLAYGDIRTDGVIADPTTFTTSTVRAGWTIGAGVEGQISGKWTAKLEYLFMDLGGVSGGLVATPTVLLPPGPCTHAPGSCTLSTTFSSRGSGITDNILRAGVNYRF
jgi:outer membrane immunogenic protein